jgi:hypothetical protein
MRNVPACELRSWSSRSCFARGGESCRSRFSASPNRPQQVRRGAALGRSHLGRSERGERDAVSWPIRWVPPDQLPPPRAAGCLADSSTRGSYMPRLPLLTPRITGRLDQSLRLTLSDSLAVSCGRSRLQVRFGSARGRGVVCRWWWRGLRRRFWLAGGRVGPSWLRAGVVGRASLR